MLATAEPTPFLAPTPPPPTASWPLPPSFTKPATEADSAAIPATSEAEADNAQYSQVFEEYLAVRQKLGESIVGLSLDKFAAKLQSNRQQLIDKYHCKTAHFTVYEKDGKAGIRAVPVR
jgi:hypothetical protein